MAAAAAVTAVAVTAVAAAAVTEKVGLHDDLHVSVSRCLYFSWNCPFLFFCNLAPVEW